MAVISFRDVHGIAEELGVDVQTVRRWIQSGKLRAFKPGKEYRVRETDLEEFLAAREVVPKAVTPPSPGQPNFNGLLSEEERIHELRSWAAFFNGFSKKWSEETQQRLAKGHGPFNWGLEKMCAALYLVQSAIEVPSIGDRDDIEVGLSRQEQQAKLALSEATDELFRAANKAYEAQRALDTNDSGIPESMITTQKRHLASLRPSA